MTDYWISTKRHRCEICNCWLDAKKRSVDRHEQGNRHKFNLQNKLRKAKQERILKEKTENKNKSMLDSINRAATKQYIKDCANGLIGSHGQTIMRDMNNNKNSNQNNSRVNDIGNNPLCIAMNNNLKYYYLSKDGNCFGPFSNCQMCLWHYYGFFVKQLRIRIHCETEFKHLSAFGNPFNYQQFYFRMQNDFNFRKQMNKHMDIKRTQSLPPSLAIPKKLIQHLMKLNRKSNVNKLQNKSIIGQQMEEVTQIIMKRNLNNRKWRRNKHGKWLCDDSDCLQKHTHSIKDVYPHQNYQQSFQSQTKSSENIISNENKIETIEDKKVEEFKKKKIELEEEERKKAMKDEFGFGKWETVTKQEFDDQHSNENMNADDKNTKKRWWREVINTNLPINKRKKTMGISQMAEEEEGNFDGCYGLLQIIGDEEDVEQLEKSVVVRLENCLKSEDSDEIKCKTESDMKIKMNLFKKRKRSRKKGRH